MKELYKNILNSVETEPEQNNDINSRVLIVDGTNTFIRCWTVIPSMNDNGNHIGGVTGTLKSIGYAIRNINPSRAIIVFDGKGGSTKRKKTLGSYKAGRKNKKLRVNRQYEDMMTDEDEKESMKRQFVWLVNLMNYLPVTTMIYDGIEADDVMGYVATQLVKEEQQSVLMSTDKDFLQLIDETTNVWSPTKKKVYNRTTLQEEYGLHPNNMLLYRILDGDVSDNIPGVDGIGLKTLLKRFPEFKEETELTVDEFLRLTEERSGKLKLYDNILNSKDIIYRNQELMQLKNPSISGVLKMKIMEKFDEPVEKMNKLEFLKVAVAYQITDHFGHDINSWLNNTFNKLVTNN